MLATTTAASANRKTSADPKCRPVTVTRAAKGSCGACPLKKGCYADRHWTGQHWERLSSQWGGKSTTDIGRARIAQHEAQSILDNWPRDGRPLRLHESGDCATSEAARTVTAAVRQAQREGAGAAWTYTHSWRDVARSAWGRSKDNTRGVSILASVETARQARQARRRGYAAAMVCDSFEQGRADLAAEGLRGIPCPAQTGLNDCESCRLCTRSNQLKKSGGVILFEPHGSGSAEIRAAITRAKAE
jgi:hypothetical protein